MPSDRSRVRGLTRPSPVNTVTKWRSDLAAGVPLTDLAVYLGDEPETIVRTYLHPTGADVCGALERLLGGCKVMGANPEVHQVQGNQAL